MVCWVVTAEADSHQGCGLRGNILRPVRKMLGCFWYFLMTAGLDDDRPR